MNLVATHYISCTHTKHTTNGLHLPSCTALHYTFPSTITPITQLSPITHLSWLSYHTCTLIHTHTFKQHTSMKTLQGLVLAPADISERYSSCYLLSLCLTRTARPWNSEPVPVTPTSAWYCLRLCPASDIPVFARWPLPVWFCLLN